MKILIAIDSSSFATQILDSVGQRTWPEDVQFRIITCVVETKSHWSIRQQFMHTCQVILDERIKAFARKLAGKEVSGELLEGDPAALILQEASEFHADLIILGSHGDTGIRRKKIGSVAAAIVNEAPCSVEVIKVKGAPGKDAKSTKAGRTGKKAPAARKRAATKSAATKSVKAKSSNETAFSSLAAI